MTAIGLESAMVDFSLSSSRGYALTGAAIGAGALVHAAVVWPPAATVAFFGGGMAIAFLAEAVAINLGWLEHHIGPTVVGVPLYLLLAWPGTIYVVFRVVQLGLDGWPAVVGTAMVATAYDVLADPQGVAEGHWSYTDDLPGPRYRGIPWWNFVGWVVISGLTAALALPFL